MPKALLARLSFVAACALAWAGCTIKEVEAPPLSGPSDFGLSYQITATPDSLSQDGGSQSTVVVRAFDANGSPKSGARFRLDMFAGGVAVDYGTLSFKDVTTGADGRAVSIYTAPPALPAGANLPTCDGLPGGCLAITATPVGSDFGTSRQQQVILHLIPLGVILPPAATPTAAFTFSSASANLPVQFDASTSCAGQTTSGGSCPTNAGTITSYEWDFGDGGTGSGRLVSHSFARQTSYNVTLTVTNDRGVKASTTKLVTVGAGSAPTAAFVYSPTPVVVRGQVYFDASASRPGIGHTIASYTWNWGDGDAPVTGSTPYQQHDFLAAGTYTVVLTVTDEVGQVGTVSQSIAATVGAPGAVFTMNPSPATVGATVTFDALGSSSTSPIQRYEWNFGDGTPIVSVNAPTTTTTHAFAVAGPYTVRLTVYDLNGSSSTITHSLTVQ